VVVDFKAAEGEGRMKAYHLDLALAGAVTPDGCRVDVAENNLLLVLHKAEPGAVWPGLVVGEGSESSGAAGTGAGAEPAKEEASEAKVNGGPVRVSQLGGRPDGPAVSNVGFRNRFVYDME
jgi:hypothetical protein